MPRARNEDWYDGSAPFHGDAAWGHTDPAQGFIKWMYPTQARFTGIPYVAASQDLRRSVLPPNHEYNWNSRDARKGRYAIVIDPTNYEDYQTARKSATNSLKATLNTIRRMFKFWPLKDIPYQNISWCTAFIFTVGSAMFIVSSFMSFLPLHRADMKDKKDEMANKFGGSFALTGSCIFVLGSGFMLLEAFNERRTARSGFSVELEFDPSNDTIPVVTGIRPTKETANVELKDFIWAPTWKDFREHYLHETGFLACAIQAVSSLVFLSPNICLAPTIYDHIKDRFCWFLAFYWVPKFIGCTGFLISGVLLCCETQSSWKPAWRTLAYATNKETREQKIYAELMLVGSFFFLIGSVVLWYESLQLYPVLVRRVAKPKRGGDIEFQDL